MAVLKFTVPEEWDNCRLRDYLKTAQKLSGTTIKRASHTEMGLTMNGMHIRTIDPIKAGAEIAVVVSDETRSYCQSDAAVDILYADGDVAVLDKPAGMPCHPSRGHPYDSLANSFAAIEGMSGKTFRPIGRLDKDTSGVVVCALHAHSAYFLTENRPKKRYLAIVSPPPKESRGSIEAPIAREGEDSIKRTVSPDGQYALTHYKTLLSDNTVALLEVEIETGRTHQIRVHMAHLGCPLVGDEIYGGDMSEIARHALHCAETVFSQPMSKEAVRVTSPLPKDMKMLLEDHFGKDALKSCVDTLGFELEEQL